jgi:hypothetical protein
MSNTGKNKGAEIIPFSRSNKDGAAALAAKVADLRELGTKARIEMILSDPSGKALARALEPQELYWLVKEFGEEDASALIMFSSPEQYDFFLDVELWEGLVCSREKSLEWIGYLLAAGEERVVEQVTRMDFELLLLICAKELIVGGGIGDMISDEERRAEWDRTFDNMFYITFRDDKHGPLMDRFLDIIFRNEHELYLRLMQTIRGEIESELEDLCYRFRSGRLADMGFPEREHALEIYRHMDPEAFVLVGGKDQIVVDLEGHLPVQLMAGDSLFQRAMSIATAEGLHVELFCLINTALVAEEKPFADHDAMESVLQRVYGYLAISLEYLSGGDEQEAARILDTEYLKRLFQLGFAIVSRLRARAERVDSSRADHATNRALLGFRKKCPRYYRGLDPDHVDGYREFMGMGDVQAVDALLRELEG